MSLAYRTPGAWGAGKGANLIPAEVDENFFELYGRVVTLEDNPIQPVSVSSYTQSGNTYTVHYTDGSSDGPFLLPVARFVWKDEWQPSTSYNPFDLFYVLSDGLYTVIQDYESGTDFDPTVANSDGPLISKMLGLIPEGKITVSLWIDNHDVTADDVGGYLRMDSGAAKAFTLPANTDTPIDVGSIVTFRAKGVGAVSVVGGAGVTINVPEDMLAVLRTRGSTATVIKVDTDEWDLSGDLVLDEGTSA